MSQPETSNSVKAASPWNITYIEVTFDVSQPETSTDVNFVQWSNIPVISITFDVSRRLAFLISNKLEKKSVLFTLSEKTDVESGFAYIFPLPFPLRVNIVPFTYAIILPSVSSEASHESVSDPVGLYVSTIFISVIVDLLILALVGINQVVFGARVSAAILYTSYYFITIL